jgi:hypothetical protein
MLSADLHRLTPPRAYDAPAPPAAPATPADYPSAALVQALGARAERGTDLDGALALWVARARAHDEPVERMLVALKQLLRAHVRPHGPDDDVQEVMALVLRRAITAYYREPLGG